MVVKKKVHETVIREVIEKSAKGRKKPKKKSAPKKPSLASVKKIESDKRIENALIENFISLQKVMVNLSVKFDGLSGQISKLLELFEISAKALAEKDFATDKEKKDSQGVVQKMDEILEQNKILARGLTLMHDRITEEGIPFSSPSPKPLPSMRPRIPIQKPSSPVIPVEDLNPADDTYQKSISSNNNDSKSYI